MAMSAKHMSKIWYLHNREKFLERDKKNQTNKLKDDYCTVLMIMCFRRMEIHVYEDILDINMFHQ